MAVLAVDRRLLGVGEDAVRLVDPDAVVAAAGIDDDPVECRPIEAEVGRAVVADVDLQRCRDTRLQAEASWSLAPFPVRVSVPLFTCAE